MILPDMRIRAPPDGVYNIGQPGAANMKIIQHLSKQHNKFLGILHILGSNVKKFSGILAKT